MKLSEVNLSSQNKIPEKRSSLDDHESRLRRQISDLQEKQKTITNDKDKTNEEKKKEKQAVQEEIQTLSSELRRYQIQKRQEEASKKQEAAKEAARETNEQDSDKKPDPDSAVYGNTKDGVLISLSATKGQLANMRQVRTTLERRRRTASTDEEKADLQKKVNNVARNIGKKVTITEENVSKLRTAGKKKSGTEGSKLNDQAFDWKSQSEIAAAASEPTEDIFRGNLAASRERFFSTVSIFIS